MNFDRIARHYRWIEALCAGRLLQRSRIAWLEEVLHCRNALILGEGNGRFLTALLQRHADIQVTCIDSSQVMLDLARQRILRDGHDPSRVRFVHADALAWHPPHAAFDLIVTHYFLDCLSADAVAAIVHKLAATSTSDAIWLLADFCAPTRWRNRLILAWLYRFFGSVAGVSTSTFTDPAPHLATQGFKLQQTRCYDWALLHSDVWQRAIIEK